MRRSAHGGARPFWGALAASALCLALACVPARAASPVSMPDYPRSVITLEPVDLAPLEPADGPSSHQPRRLEAFRALDLAGREGGDPVAVLPGPGGRGLASRLGTGLDLAPWPPRWRVGLGREGLAWWAPASALAPAPVGRRPGDPVTVSPAALGRLPAAITVLAAGPAEFHAKRLERLAKANLPAAEKRRLAAGIIRPGDSLWLVELAWGKAPRAFMVNYFQDEQHFVYKLPGGPPLILRFPDGKLAGPLAQNRLAPPQVASPPSPR